MWLVPLKDRRATATKRKQKYADRMLHYCASFRSQPDNINQRVLNCGKRHPLAANFSAPFVIFWPFKRAMARIQRPGESSCQSPALPSPQPSRASSGLNLADPPSKEQIGDLLCAVKSVSLTHQCRRFGLSTFARKHTKPAMMHRLAYSLRECTRI